MEVNQALLSLSLCRSKQLHLFGNQEPEFLFPSGLKHSVDGSRKPHQCNRLLAKGVVAAVESLLLISLAEWSCYYRFLAHVHFWLGLGQYSSSQYYYLIK